jgi:hypothetical protein
MATDEKQVDVITEQDLLKSIKALEPKKEGETHENKPDQVVETGGLTKSTADTIKDNGSAGLKKVLDVSETLSEVVDLSIVRVLSDLKKSIDENTEAVKAFGAQPGRPASLKLVETGGEQPIQKSAGGAKTADPTKLRKEILTGLEKLAKSAPLGSQDALRYVTATAKFEAAGEIDDATLAEVKAALGGTKAA